MAILIGERIMISRLEEFLSPMANKLGNQRHLQSISKMCIRDRL